MYNPNIITEYTKGGFLDSRGSTPSTRMMQFEGQRNDNYIKILLKLIPSEIIVFYVSTNNILDYFLSENETIVFVNYFFWVFMTPLYAKKVKKIEVKYQNYLSIIAFVVWTFIAGSPFHEHFNEITGIGMWLAVIFSAIYLLLPRIYIHHEEK